MKPTRPARPAVRTLLRFLMTLPPHWAAPLLFALPSAAGGAA